MYKWIVTPVAPLRDLVIEARIVRLDHKIHETVDVLQLLGIKFRCYRRSPSQLRDHRECAECFFTGLYTFRQFDF